MTEQELAEIEARTNAATPGPWFLHGKRADYEDDFVWAPHDQSADNPCHPLTQQLAEGYGIESVCHVAMSGNWDADRAFIAAARTDMPDLVAEIRLLRAENERLRDGLGAIIRRWANVADQQSEDRPLPQMRQALIRLLEPENPSKY